MTFVRQLELLGYTKDDNVYIRLIPGEDKKVKTRKVLFKNIEKLNIDAYISEGYDVYFVVNGGGNKDKDVKVGRAVFYEHDGLSIEEQLELWKKLDLPEPTFQIHTGGKSIHNYWTFNEYVDIDDWEQLQRDLIAYANADRKNCNPSRVMRVAGYPHSGTGIDAKIVNSSGTRYEFEGLRDCIPAALNEDRLEAREELNTSLGDGIPLEIALANANKRVLTEGAEVGDRNNAYYKLAIDLIGVEQAFKKFGMFPREGAREVFNTALKFCTLDSDEVEKIWESAVAGCNGPCLSDERLYTKVQRWRQKTFNLSKVVVLDQDAEDPIKMSGKAAIQFIESMYGFEHNELTMEIEFEREVYREFEQLHVDMLQKYNVLMGKELAWDISVYVANQNRYHPVREYLVNVDRDVKPLSKKDFNNISTLLLGTPVEDWQSNVFLRRFLISAVARIFEPGCKVDQSLILQGGQHMGKSTFWKNIAGEKFFGASLGTLQHVKDDTLTLHSAWIHEWGEFDRVTNDRNLSAIKHFVTIQTDLVRPPYGRKTQRFPRQCVIAGTTNKDLFLLDDENRRNPVIPIRKFIDVDRVCELRDRVWSTAVKAYRAGERWDYRGIENNWIEVRAFDYKDLGSLESEIVEYLADKEEVTINQVLDEVYHVERKDFKKHEKEVRAVLVAYEWEQQARRRVKGLGNVKTWKRTKKTEVAECKIEGTLKGATERRSRIRENFKEAVEQYASASTDEGVVGESVDEMFEVLDGDDD